MPLAWRGIGWAPSRVRVGVESPHDRAWKASIDAARAFRERQGHLNVPTKHVEAGQDGAVKLGAWLNNVRRRNKNGKIPQRRVEELDALAMRW